MHNIKSLSKSKLTSCDHTRTLLLLFAIASDIILSRHGASGIRANAIQDEIIKLIISTLIIHSYSHKKSEIVSLTVQYIFIFCECTIFIVVIDKVAKVKQ